MGNCFTSCFVKKENLAERSLSEKSLSTDIKSERSETATKSLPKVSPTVRKRKNNRVAPVSSNDNIGDTDSNKTLQGSTRFLYPLSGSSESIMKFESDSNKRRNNRRKQSSSRNSRISPNIRSSSRSSISRLEDKSSVAASYEDSSSSSVRNSVKSRPLSIKIEPGKTQGRLIIVQPFLSVTPSSYDSSSENLRGRIYHTGKVCSSTDSNSVGLWSESVDQLDNYSEEESAPVHPYSP